MTCSCYLRGADKNVKKWKCCDRSWPPRIQLPHSAVQGMPAKTAVLSQQLVQHAAAMACGGCMFRSKCLSSALHQRITYMFDSAANPCHPICKRPRFKY